MGLQNLSLLMPLVANQGEREPIIPGIAVDLGDITASQTTGAIGGIKSSSLAMHNGTLYTTLNYVSTTFTRGVIDLYSINPTAVSATRIGTTRNFGISDIRQTAAISLESFRGGLYMLHDRKLYFVNTSTGAVIFQLAVGVNGAMIAIDNELYFLEKDGVKRWNLALNSIVDHMTVELSPFYDITAAALLGDEVYYIADSGISGGDPLRKCSKTFSDIQTTNVRIPSCVGLGVLNRQMYAITERRPPELYRFDAVVAPATAPSSLASSVVGTTATWTWDAFTGATGYDWELRTGTTGAATDSGSVTAATYEATGLAAGTTYQLRVRAKNSGGTGPWTSWVNAMIAATPAPSSAPANLTATVSGTNASWAFDAVTGAISYKWEHRVGTSGAATSNGAVTRSPLALSGLAAGTHQVRVRASNSGGDGPWSAWVSAVIAAAPTHTFTFQATGGRSNTQGWSVPNGWGTAVGGSTNVYDTPGGKTVTIVHCRSVTNNNEINFALTGAANEAADFPTRLVVTKTTGGTVTREFTVQPSSRRVIGGPVRQDYESDTGNVADIFVNNQTIQVEIYYS